MEITSRTNRQSSLMRPPLRVSGQLFQITPDGRIGVSRGEIGQGGQQLLDAAREAFGQAFEVAAAISAVMLMAGGVVAAVLLRDVPSDEL